MKRSHRLWQIEGYSDLGAVSVVDWWVSTKLQWVEEGKNREIISHTAKVYIERDQLTYRIKQRDIQNRYIMLSQMQNMKI